MLFIVVGFFGVVYTIDGPRVIERWDIKEVTAILKDKIHYYEDIRCEPPFCRKSRND